MSMLMRLQPWNKIKLKTKNKVKALKVIINVDVDVSAVELWNRILESLIKVGCPSRFKSFLSDFLTGRKPLLLWSF